MRQSFVAEESGGIAPMVGVAFTMMLFATGAAVDYSYAKNKRYDLQKTADAAVLAAAALPAASDTERMKRAEMIFTGSKFCENNPCDAPSVSMDDGAVVISGVAYIETSLLKVAGYEDVEVAVTARAVPAVDTKVDVVMILDYSGSMNRDNKFQDMAAAATQFLDSAEAQAGENMAVGVIPFSKYILSPMRGRYLYDVSAGTDLLGQDVVGCILNREHPHSTNVDEPSTADVGSLWPVFSYSVGSAPGSGTYSDIHSVPRQGYTSVDFSYTLNGVEHLYTVEYYDNNPGVSPTIYQHNSYTDPNTGESGVIFDGQGKLHISVTPNNGHPFQILNQGSPGTQGDPFANFGGYGGSAGWTIGDDSGLPTVYNQNLLAEDLSSECGKYATNSLWVRPLDKNFEELRTSINAMRPFGLTNIALGLDLGWHMLTPEAPFTEATVSEEQVNKVAILLTDGVQTVRAHGADGSVSIGSANANVAESCEAMKQDGVEVFTIAFGIEDAFTRNLLEECASGAPYYFEPSAGGDLDAVFEGIFNKIASGAVRLTG